MRRVAAGVLAVLLLAGAGCSRRSPAARPDAGRRGAATTEEARRLERIRLEGARDLRGGRLVALARAGAPVARAEALRALGRIGGADAAAVLRDAIADPDERVRRSAIEGLWLSRVEAATPSLVAAAAGATPRTRVAIVKALGHVGDARALPVLAAALAGAADPALATEAAIALGLLGRRGVAWDEGARRAVLAAATRAPGDSGAKGATHAPLAWGVAYALAHETPPMTGAAGTAALERLATHHWAETRAIAVKGLARRGAFPDEVLTAALDDARVEVRVEAVRALAAPGATAPQHARVADWVAREWLAIGDLEERIRSDRLHAVLEGLVVLAPYARDPAVREALELVHAATSVRESTERARYGPDVLRATDAAHCLSAAALARGGHGLEALAGCGDPSGAGWPLVRRRMLLADTIAVGGGTPVAAAKTLGELAADRDERVRAAAGAAAVRRGVPALDDDVARLLTAGSDVAVDVVAGALAERAPPRTAGAWPAALRARAARELGEAARDPGALLAVVNALGVLRVADAAPLLAPARTHPNRSIRDAIRKALTSITGRDPGAAEAAGPLPPPPVDPASALGRRPTLVVTTTKGVFRVALDPELAPWNVAHLVALAQRGAFDGTPWHRVVPDFVVQGGDPTGTGSGGPGYVVPAEPSAAPYTRGAVGIADAGLDTGGSQWFVTLAPSPHLEGRYTLVGYVADADLPVVDRLIVGDSIVKATVELAAGRP